MTPPQSQINPSLYRGRPRRILHVGKYFPPHPGGMETYLRDLMSAQSRAGLEVTALVHASEAGIRDATTVNKNSTGKAYSVTRAASLGTLGFVPLAPLFLLSLSKVIREFRPDVVHFHLPNASALWALALPAARRIPWVVTWQSDVLTPISSRWVHWLYRIYQPFEQALLKKTRWILVSSATYGAHSTALSDWRKKLRVVALGIDHTRLPDPATISALPRGARKVVLSAGRLAHYKGLPLLIAAIQSLPEVELWIAGSGLQNTELRQLVDQLKVGDRVRFWGRVDDPTLWQLYKTCDVFCLASTDKTESFGMVLLEADHFGCPVVAADVPESGVGWVADQLSRGVKVPAGDAMALAKGICEALEHDRKAEKQSSSDVGSGDSTAAALDLNQQTGQISAIYSELD